MKKVLLIFGTRPEAIKMAPIIKELQKNPSYFRIKVCITAQHREMLDQVLSLFEILPDYDLNIMKPGQDLFGISSDILMQINNVFLDFEPDLVLVHGDTTTSSVVAIGAYYRKINVGHVEAGLRTGNIYSPWPEEVNRQITGVIANLHFTPTLSSKNNLLKENKAEEKIVITGNTVIDALFMVLNKIKSDTYLQKSIIKKINVEYNFSDNRKFILVTGHRRENFGEGFINICDALKKIALSYPGIDIVYPVHLNPNVQNIVKQKLSKIKNIYLITPQPYDIFIFLMSKSFIILTDSGGIQEEAPSLGKPVLVMRDTTERPEALEAGTIKLTGNSVEGICTMVKDLIENEDIYNQMISASNPFGDGCASKKIVNHIISFYHGN